MVRSGWAPWGGFLPAGSLPGRAAPGCCDSSSRWLCQCGGVGKSLRQAKCRCQSPTECLRHPSPGSLHPALHLCSMSSISLPPLTCTCLLGNAYFASPPVPLTHHTGTPSEEKKTSVHAAANASGWKKTPRQVFIVKLPGVMGIRNTPASSMLRAAARLRRPAFSQLRTVSVALRLRGLLAHPGLLMVRSRGPDSRAATRSLTWLPSNNACAAQLSSHLPVPGLTRLVASTCKRRPIKRRAGFI